MSIDRVNDLLQESVALYRLGATSEEAFAQQTTVLTQRLDALRQQQVAGRQASAQHRMGVQQLGLQFNDFGTQVSAGINPIVAFNQQLGQVGFAMSQMEGRAGAVGAFLAGPWGAAIAIGAAALGALAGKFIDNDDAARRAAEGMEEFRRRQDDIKNFIDETTGALREQNEVLINNAILTKQAKLEANAEAADAARRRAVFAASNAAGQFGTLTPGSSGGAQAPLTAGQNELRELVAATGDNVERLDAGLRSLAARYPELRGTIRVVSDNAAQAVLAARENKRLQDEIDVLTGRTDNLRGANAALIESQVEVATATTQTARAEAQLEQVRRQGRAELQSGTITNEQYRQRLTLATQAVNAARESDRSLAAARRASVSEGRREQREAERDYERLMEQSQRFVDQMQREREEMGLTQVQLIRLNAARQARAAAATGTQEGVGMASAIIDEAERLIAALVDFRLPAVGRVNLQELNVRVPEITTNLELLADELREVNRLSQDAAWGMASAFGDAGRALGDLLTTMTEYQSRQAEISLAVEQGRMNEARADRERAFASIGMYGDMTAAARGFFKEGSDGYNILLAAERAWRIFQFAMSVAAMIQDDTATAKHVANAGIKATASAGAGAAKIFEDLGAYAFPVVAAMLALLAGLGLSGGGGGGGGGSRSSANTAMDDTNAVRAAGAREAQARDTFSASVASQVEVRVTADRDGLDAYVVGTAEKVARPIAEQAGAVAFGAARTSMAADIEKERTYSLRRSTR